jgi:hypothetical protein
MRTEPISTRTPRLLPVAALAAFAPLMAEFVLGDQYLAGQIGAGQQMGEFALFVLWYGMAAIVIREVVRRTGRGWPTILLLGLGFGLIEEGLLTQSLFNPHYLGLELLSYGYVGWLGTGVPWAIFVLSIHVVWSIATPIALIEAIFPHPSLGRGAERFRAAHPDLVDHPLPWLGRIGVGVVVGVMVLGGAATFAISYLMSSPRFLAHPAQLIGAALLAAIAVAAGMALQPGPVRPARRWLPALLGGLVLSTSYQLVRYLLPTVAPAGLTVVLMLAVLTLAVIACAALRLDVTGVAAGAALTYCWVGMTNAVRTGPVAIVEQAVIVLIVLAVIVLAIRRRGREGGAPRDADEAGSDQDEADREDTDQNRRSSARSMPRSAS